MQMDKTESERMEEMALEMIRFLQKWGLWTDASILTNGNRYSYSPDPKKCDCGLPHTEFEQDVDPEQAMKGLTASGWKSLANPEHIFDMIYEGPLCMLLRYCEYETESEEISLEAWEYIFDHTNMLREHLGAKHGVCSQEELLEEIKTMPFEYYCNMCAEISCNGVPFDGLWDFDDRYFDWDPLVFDTWEEYLEFMDHPEGSWYKKTRPQPLYELFDTYAEYLKEPEKFESITMDDVQPIWNEMVEDTKKDLMKGGLVNIPEVFDHILSEFDSVFEKYGLWYDLCFDWSCSAYRL